MAKDKEKKLKNKNKKLKKKLENALRHIATLEGKDPDQFINSFEQNDSKSTTSKLLSALGLEERTAKTVASKLESAGYAVDKTPSRMPACEIDPCDVVDNWKEKTFKTVPVKCFESDGKDGKKNLETMVRELVDYYCDREHVISDQKRSALVKYIMSDDEDARKAFKYLREYKGDLNKSDFPSPDSLSNDPELRTFFANVFMNVKQAGLDLTGGKAIVEQIVA